VTRTQAALHLVVLAVLMAALFVYVNGGWW
jgi:hypothetical protein